jgi:hypothetical protein
VASRAQRIEDLFRVAYVPVAAVATEGETSRNSREVAKLVTAASGLVPLPSAESEDDFEAEKEKKRQQSAKSRAKRLASNAKRARAAARKLEQGSQSDLDLDLLLCELTVDTKVKHITFAVGDGAWAKHFTFTRMQLRRIAQERPRNGRMGDLRGWIDTKGLHLRWGSNGGFNLTGLQEPVMDSTTLLVSFLKGEQP